MPVLADVIPMCPGGVDDHHPRLHASCALLLNFLSTFIGRRTAYPFSLPLGVNGGDGPSTVSGNYGPGTPHAPRRLDDNTAEPHSPPRRTSPLRRTSLLFHNCTTILFSSGRVNRHRWRAGRRANVCTGEFGWKRRGWDHGGGRSCGVHECQCARERQFAL